MPLSINGVPNMATPTKIQNKNYFIVIITGISYMYVSLSQNYHKQLELLRKIFKNSL